MNPPRPASALDVDSSVQPRPATVRRHKVFISYAWDTRHGPYHRWVGAFGQWLRDRGVDVMHDQRPREGILIKDWITQSIERATAVVFLCSPSFQKKLSAPGSSEYLKWELELALARSRLGRLEIYVVVVEGLREDAVPPALAGFDARELTAGRPDYLADYRDLVESLGGEPAPNFVPYKRWAARRRAWLQVGTMLAFTAALAGLYRFWPCDPMPDFQVQADAAQLLQAARRVVHAPTRQHCRDERLLALLLWDDPGVRNAASAVLDHDPERDGDERCDLTLRGLRHVAPPASPRPLTQLLPLFNRYCAGRALPPTLCTRVDDPRWTQALNGDGRLRLRLEHLCKTRR